MQTKRGGALAAGVMVLLGAAGVVFSQRPATPPPLAGTGVPLVKRLAVRTKLSEKTVKAVLDALGPEVLAEIQRGGVETLPQLGRIRIVRIPEPKDIERGTGRVITLPAKNYVIFEADGEVATAANAYEVVPNEVVPKEVVPQSQSNVMPGQTPSLKTESLKVRSIRTP